MVAAAVVTLALALGRPDQVPPGEANPWVSTDGAAAPTSAAGPSTGAR